MKKVFTMVFIVFINVINAHAQSIADDFSAQKTSITPDYSQEEFWSALPWREDTPDEVPSKDYIDRQDIASVDVFFVHPTTISKKYGLWNGDLEDEKLNAKVDNLPVHLQAGVFNGSAKIYAPRYRQANYEAFMQLGQSNSNQALSLAYGDVKAAFLYYLENWNEGRPFIIAGHSQGTFHSITLIQELVDTTALIDQMLAAYLVGMPIQEGDFVNCEPCQDEAAVNCFLTWNTMKKNSYPKFYKEFFEGAICHNPLSWELNEIYCDSDCNGPLLPRNFKKFKKKEYGAKVENGILWVDAVKLPGIPFTRLVKNWHIGDYNLFYANIRKNVNLRVNEYLEQNNLKKWEIVNLESEVK